MNFLNDFGLPDMNHDGNVDIIDAMIVDDLMSNEEVSNENEFGEDNY